MSTDWAITAANYRADDWTSLQNSIDEYIAFHKVDDKLRAYIDGPGDLPLWQVPEHWGSEATRLQALKLPLAPTTGSASNLPDLLLHDIGPQGYTSQALDQGNQLKGRAVVESEKHT